MYHVNAMRFLFGRYDPIAESAMTQSALIATRDRLSERYGMLLDIDAFSQMYLRDRTVTYGLLYDALMSYFWLRGGKSHWLEKAQLVWREIPAFLEMMENGRAIMVIRDPRSVLASFKSYTYAAPPAYLGAIFNCRDAMYSASQYLKNFDRSKFMLVRYETAAVEPEKTARDIYEFIGLNAEDAEYDPTTWRDSLGQPWRANSSFDKAERTFNVEKSIGRWRDNLADWEISLTDYVCGEFYQQFGYEAAALPVDLDAAYAHIGNDPQINAFLNLFRSTGQGVQAFPTDPTDEGNWEENAVRINT